METNEQFEARMRILGIPKVEGLIYSKWIDGKLVTPDDAAEDNWKALNAAFNPKAETTSRPVVLLLSQRLLKLIEGTADRTKNYQWPVRCHPDYLFCDMHRPL